VFFTVIFSVLSFLNLHFTLLVGLIGVVLYFTGVLDSNQTVLVIYALVLAATVLYAVIASIRKLLGLNKKAKRSKGVQIVPEDDKNTSQGSGIVPNLPQQQIVDGYIVPAETPKFYRAKQDPSYVIADYSDRYEVYKIENDGLKKVRTDYKQRRENNDRVF
jgi:hypothetical protein